MKLKTVSFCLYGVILLILFNKINCIANQDIDKNLITEEERRGAAPMFDQLKSKSEKRGIYVGSSKLPSYPTGYGQTSPGFTTYERPHYPPPPLPPPPPPPPSPNGHSFPIYESDHTPTGFGGYGHGNSYGHSEPSGEGYGHKDHGYKDYGHKALALKSVLLPLAGIALLGAAAALTTSPVLLQLGVVNGRRRRRRSLDDNGQVYPENPYVRPELN